MLAKNAMIKKICLHFLGKTQNKICFINTKSKNRLIKEISIPDFFGTETPHRNKKANKSKKEKNRSKKKKSWKYIHTRLFWGETSYRNKNKQTSKKKKRKEKTGTTKTLEELEVVMVAIVTEALKLLHLQVPNIANIK